MIKKTFLAVAVGAALGAVGANAATVTTTDNADFTNEAAENLLEFAVPDIDVTLDAEYQIDDELTFVFNTPVTGDFETTVEVEADNEDYNMTLGLLSSDSDASSTTLVYRVTELTSTDDGVGISTVDGSFTIVGDGLLTVDGDAGRDGVSVSYTARTSNLAGEVVTIDSGDSNDFYSFVPQQYALSAPSATFSKTIDSEVGTGFMGMYLKADEYDSMGNRDVVASRSFFTDGTPIDGASITLSEDTTAASRTAMTTEVVAVLTGDFTFIEDEEAMGAELDGNSPTDVALTDTSIIYTWTGSELDPVVLGDLIFSFNNQDNGDGEVAMDPGAISLGVSIAYSPLDEDYVGESDNTPHAAAGEGFTAAESLNGWDIDSSRVHVYAVPYSPSASLFLWVTSTTSNDAPYAVYATDVDGNSDMVASGVLAPNSITTLASDVIEGMEAANLEFGRVTLTIETSAEMCNINVYAGYEQTVDNDRLNLETSQTIQGIHNGGNSGVVDDLCKLDYAETPNSSLSSGAL